MESEGSKIVLSYLMHELKSSCFDGDSEQSIFQKISESFELYFLDTLPYHCCRCVFMNEGAPDKSLEILNRLKQIKTLTLQQTNPKARTSSHDSDKKKMKMWSMKEDNRLLAGILLWGPTNWRKIAAFVGNGRTRAQCSQRWNRGLDPTIRKDAWLPEEDQKLIDLVNEIGGKQWSKLSSLMGTRSDVQCRYRYMQLIRKKAIVKKDGINTLQDSFRLQRPYRMCTKKNQFNINYHESSSEDIHDENNNLIQHNCINNSNQNDDMSGSTSGIASICGSACGSSSTSGSNEMSLDSCIDETDIMHLMNIKRPINSQFNNMNTNTSTNVIANSVINSNLNSIVNSNINSNGSINNFNCNMMNFNNNMNAFYNFQVGADQNMNVNMNFNQYGYNNQLMMNSNFNLLNQNSYPNGNVSLNSSFVNNNIVINAPNSFVLQENISPKIPLVSEQSLDLFLKCFQ